MNEPVLLLVLLNFGFIGLLTLTFFRRDFRPSLGWWATALPHVLGPVFLAVGFALELAPITPREWGRVLDLFAVALCAVSIALMFFARGTHRIPLAHFHQADDAPQHIVTYGAYRRIRHPFYTSYIFLYTAAVLLLPHWTTLALLAYILVAFNRTAAREERRLRASEFGSDYASYIGRTGRFFPPLVGRPAEPAPPAPEPVSADQRSLPPAV